MVAEEGFEPTHHIFFKFSKSKLSGNLLSLNLITCITTDALCALPLPIWLLRYNNMVEDVGLEPTLARL